MKITKYLHSCVLLEKDGKRLLIDPGTFTFIEKRVTPEEIGPVDAILVTHAHADHEDSEAIEKFKTLGKTEVHTYATLEPGNRYAIAGFDVETFEAPHEKLPMQAPYNLAYFVDKTLFHPGDSYAVAPPFPCPLLALPTFAPWAHLNMTLAFLDRVKPKAVIPIHDGFVKEFMLKRMYEGLFLPQCNDRGIEFTNLKLGEST